MISIKLHYRPSSRDGDHQGRLFFRLIYRRSSLEISSEFKISTSEWDSQSNKIRLPFIENKRFTDLEQMNHKLKQLEQTLQIISNALSQKGNFTLKDVQTAYHLHKHSNSFYHFVKHLSSSMHHQERTTRAYESTQKRFLRFNKGFDISMDSFSAELIKNFEQYLKREDLKLNTISFYMRNLRAIYNKAVSLKRVAKPLDNPFEGVYTGVQITKKRALESPEVFRIVSLDMEKVIMHHDKESDKKELLEKQDHFNDLCFAKDLFSFSFFARGMSFVDIAFLKKTDIQDGILSYRRKKTGQQLEVSITNRLQTIIEKYKKETGESEYVFPIIKNDDLSTYKQYQSGLRRQNILLKELAKLSEVNKTVTTHVARHSWATIAKKENTPIWEISESLGHSSVKTTYIYLASLERSKLDAVNDRVALAVGF